MNVAEIPGQQRPESEFVGTEEAAAEDALINARAEGYVAWLEDDYGSNMSGGREWMGFRLMKVKAQYPSMPDGEWSMEPRNRLDKHAVLNGPGDFTALVDTDDVNLEEVLGTIHELLSRMNSGRKSDRERLKALLESTEKARTSLRMLHELGGDPHASFESAMSAFGGLSRELRVLVGPEYLGGLG